MTDAETIVGGGGIAAVLGFLRWAMGLWATVRREDIAATTARSTADREADARQSERQVAAIDRLNVTVSDHTARDIAAQAEVKQSVARLEGKIDERARAEHPSERRRKQTHPTGIPSG